MAQVVVELNGEEVARQSLNGGSLTIGRDKSADLYLDNRALSRRHAQVENIGAAIWIRDLGSQNGTFVNGERIEDPRHLKSDDIIELGRYRIRIEGVEEASPTMPVLTLSGPEGRHRFAMVGDEIIIGRAPNCDIAIGHKSISRRHVRISLQNGQFSVEDMGSQNGTRVDGKRITGLTPFEPGALIQMSDFTIEVGLMDDGSGAAGAGDRDRASKTMMIDRSELAKAAYVDGDFDRMKSAAGRLALGRRDATGRSPADDSGEDSVTRGIAEGDPLPPRPPSRGADVAKRPPSMARPPTAPKAHGGRVTLSHPDQGERVLILDDEVTVVGEDGRDGDPCDGKTFAPLGYLLFLRTPTGIAVTVAGDRRLVAVNGVPRLYARLQEGDTVEFGLLSAVYGQ